MRILLSDDKGPGLWEIAMEPSRDAEDEQPSQLKIAAILGGIANDLVIAEVIRQNKPIEREDKPRLALPGRDFSSGSL